RTRRFRAIDRNHSRGIALEIGSNDRKPDAGSCTRDNGHFPLKRDLQAITSLFELLRGKRLASAHGNYLPAAVCALFRSAFSSSLFTISRPIMSDAVAAGDGTLHTCRMRARYTK